MDSFNLGANDWIRFRGGCVARPEHAGGSGEDREVKLKLKAFNGVQDDLSDLIWSYRRRLRDATWQLASIAADTTYSTGLLPTGR